MAERSGNGRRTPRAVVHVAVLALVMTTAGCAAQSEMTDLWRDPSFTSGPIHKPLVVALRKDPVRRRIWEDAFVNELGARGLTATPSYQLFPEAPPDSQELIRAVRSNGYDAVLTSIRLPSETMSTYVPGTTRRESVVIRDFYGGFHARWRDVQDPGYVETDEIQQFQTELWATGASDRLIWSGTLRTLESANNRNIEAAVSKEILPLLEEQALIPKKKS